MPTPSKGGEKPAKTTAAIPADVDTRTDEERAQEEAEAAAARDEQGATLVQADLVGDIKVGNTVLTPVNTPVLEGDDWEKVVVAAGAPERLPPHKGERIIVAERRTQPDENGAGGGLFDEKAAYSKNADAYVGHLEFDADDKPRNPFADASGPVFLLGGNVKQFGLGGVSRQHGFLSVGPGSSVVAAVNLALQKGAKEVRVVGLSDHDRAVVGPWLDKIAGEFEVLEYGAEE